MRVGMSRGLMGVVTASIALFGMACSGGGAGTGQAANGGKMYKLGLVYFAPEVGVDNVLKGLFDGLKAQGIEEGKNLEVRRAHAQAEISNIPMLVQNYDNQDVDAIVTLTTPVLQGAVGMAKKKPVVFTYVYDPLAAGAGTSRNDHLPFVTGVGSFPPIGETIEAIEQMVPNVKTVGTIYNGSEANSVKVMSVARGLFEMRSIELKEVSVASTNEVYQAAQAMAQRGVQALWITGDNTAIQAFDAIARVAQDAKLPLIINDPDFVDRGALAAVGISWYESGEVASKLLGRVLRGESPRAIPIENVAKKKIVLNEAVAKRLGLTFPDALVKAAAGE